MRPLPLILGILGFAAIISLSLPVDLLFPELPRGAKWAIGFILGILAPIPLFLGIGRSVGVLALALALCLTAEVGAQCPTCNRDGCTRIALNEGPVRSVVKGTAKVGAAAVRGTAKVAKAAVKVGGCAAMFAGGRKVKAATRVVTAPVRFVAERKPVRRSLGAAARVATAPLRFRPLARIRFAPMARFHFRRCH